MRKKLILLLILLLPAYLYAQTDTIYYPAIGQKIKDHTFTRLMNYEGNSFKISDYRGKWLVLDIWTRYCAGCIASLPKMDTLYREFKGRAEIIMVGLTHHLGTERSDEAYTKTIFAMRTKKYDLKIPSAFDDQFEPKFDVYGTPSILIINPEGTLVAKAKQINAAFLNDIIAGKQPSYDRSYSYHEPRPESGWKPELDTTSTGSSILTRWNDTMPGVVEYGFSKEDQVKRPGQARLVGFDASQLFRIAYMGVSYWFPGDSLFTVMPQKIIFDTPRKAQFENPLERRNSSTSYAYDLRCQSNDPFVMRNYLLEDLHRYLNLTSKIEMRKVTIYKLVVTDLNKVKKLKSKGGKPGVVLSNARPEMIVTNYSMNDFFYKLGVIWSGLAVVHRFGYSEIPPLFNATGIDFNIDFDLVADIQDIDQVVASLRKNGLDLVKGEKEMKCIVVKDGSL